MVPAPMAAVALLFLVIGAGAERVGEQGEDHGALTVEEPDSVSTKAQKDPGLFKNIKLAACDLDKTLYPPEGEPNQLKANTEAMFAFEGKGGMVFPVTGNNLLMAQQKFKNGDTLLRDLKTTPGIYVNGALSKGKGGDVLEKWSHGDLLLQDDVDFVTKHVDFVTKLLDFADALIREDDFKDFSVDESENDSRLGLVFLTDAQLLGYKPNGESRLSVAPVHKYAKLQKVQPTDTTREELLEKKHEILLILWLWPYGPGDENFNSTAIKGQQQALVNKMEAKGLLKVGKRENKQTKAEENTNAELTPMLAPWPEIDITTSGVSKGATLGRFVKSKDITNVVGVVDVTKNLAVFGDAENDLSMFQNVDDKQPALRVAMPHAVQKLIDNSNVVGQVSEVLKEIVNATEKKD